VLNVSNEPWALNYRHDGRMHPRRSEWGQASRLARLHIQHMSLVSFTPSDAISHLYVRHIPDQLPPRHLPLPVKSKGSDHDIVNAAVDVKGIVADHFDLDTRFSLPADPGTGRNIFKRRSFKPRRTV